MINNVYTNEEVIHGIVNQDLNILEFIYQENYKRVQEYLEKKVGDKSNVTEDIFEIALFTIYFRGRDGLLKLNGSFQTYLLSLVKIVWHVYEGYSEKKITRNKECNRFISEYPGIITDIITARRKTLYIKHFNELTTESRKLLKLVVNKLPFSEITQMMGYCSEEYTRCKYRTDKKMLIEKISQDSIFKELTDGRKTKKNFQLHFW